MITNGIRIDTKVIQPLLLKRKIRFKVFIPEQHTLKNNNFHSYYITSNKILK